MGTLGGIATAIFLGISSFCQNLISLAICYGVLCGFGFGMVYISLIVSCGFYFKKRLALAQGIMAVGASIGNITILMYDIENAKNSFSISCNQ